MVGIDIAYNEVYNGTCKKRVLYMLSTCPLVLSPWHAVEGRAEVGQAESFPEARVKTRAINSGDEPLHLTVPIKRRVIGGVGYWDIRSYSEPTMASIRSLLPDRARLAGRSCFSHGTAATRHHVQAQAQRQYSIQAPDASDPALSKVDVSRLSITKTTTPKPITPNSELVFGRTFTDHMMSLEWTSTEGWLPPRITPYQNLSLDPATCVLHYAFEAFEGTKAYKDKHGGVRLFRPDKNMARLNKSVARIALPTFDGNAVIDLLKQYVKLEERFIPS